MIEVDNLTKVKLDLVEARAQMARDLAAARDNLASEQDLVSELRDKNRTLVEQLDLAIEELESLVKNHRVVSADLEETRGAFSSTLRSVISCWTRASGPISPLKLPCKAPWKNGTRNWRNWRDEMKTARKDRRSLADKLREAEQKNVELTEKIEQAIANGKKVLETEKAAFRKRLLDRF